ncbi:5-formyltetrahydrofolate cyclo-ligase [Corynebacterium mayonis]|uniref:5-formyltetrahydrofolate cyclo-ligase n=1 Tax=Corynebacterium mayonis TaxID=3062461 RepID=UPI00314059BC
MPTKQQVRKERLASRRFLAADPATKRRLDEQLVANTVSYLCDSGLTGNVAAYNPLPSEPGGDFLVPRLAGVCRRLFLPISLTQGVLAWASYSPSFSIDAFGVSYPNGARFNSHVLRSCDVVLVPALAVDKHGMRLGKGAGYYDRALRGIDVPLAALLYDDDLVAEVPHDQFDVPVGVIITPGGNRTVLGAV